MQNTFRESQHIPSFQKWESTFSSHSASLRPEWRKKFRILPSYTNEESFFFPLWRGVEEFVSLGRPSTASNRPSR